MRLLTMKAKGFELIGSANNAEWAAQIVLSHNITLGAGEGYLPLFVDYQTPFDVEIFCKTYANWEKQEPLLKTFNSRPIYGVDHLFRSASLDGASVDDVTILRHHGVRAAIDLRTRQIDEVTKRLLELNGIEYHSIPLRPTWVSPGTSGITIEEGVTNTYQSYLRFIEQEDTIRHILQVIKDRPAIVFCAYGKDRTGLIAALIQTMAGVSIQDIVMDYAISYLNLALRFGNDMKRDLSANYDKLIRLDLFAKIIDEWKNKRSPSCLV